jgi:nucleoside-diphosphate-sugar epimerase
MYGETKAQADKWCQIYAQRFGLPICVTRIFSCSSPLQPKTYFVPAMVEKVKNSAIGATLEARGLNGTRDFLTTVQVCTAIRFLFQKRITGVFNLGSGQPIKLIDMVEAIKVRLNRSDVVIKAQGQETHHLVANVEKLASVGLKLDFKIDSFLDYVLEK